MTFTDAIELLKKGKKVWRKSGKCGWNKLQNHLYLEKPNYLRWDDFIATDWEEYISENREPNAGT